MRIDNLIQTVPPNKLDPSAWDESSVNNPAALLVGEQASHVLRGLWAGAAVNTGQACRCTSTAHRHVMKIAV